jgi:hypothetical protein
LRPSPNHIRRFSGSSAVAPAGAQPEVEQFFKFTTIERQGRQVAKKFKLERFNCAAHAGFHQMNPATAGMAKIARKGWQFLGNEAGVRYAHLHVGCSERQPDRYEDLGGCHHRPLLPIRIPAGDQREAEQPQAAEDIMAVRMRSNA